jgi:predicted ATP-grasp superfamily ATP-dependent carboligase
VGEVWIHPPINRPQQFLAALHLYCESRKCLAFVFPLGDFEIALLAPVARTFPVRVAVVAAETIAICQDKQRLLRLATSVGVRTEPWENATTAGEVRIAAGRLGYPLVLKPNASDASRGDAPMRGQLSCKATIVSDRLQLDRHIDAGPRFPDGVLVQRQSKGPRHNVYFAAYKGQLRGHAEFQILRTDRLDDTGLAVEGISVVPDPDLLRQTSALVAALEYTGIGCAQYIVDPRDGRPCFLEINARLGANCGAVVACGLDLPRLFLALMDGDIAPPEPGWTGCRYAWLSGDLQGLGDNLRAGSVSARQALTWSLRMLRAALIARVHVTFSLRDPLPTLVMLWRGLTTLGSAVYRRRLKDAPSAPCS